MADTVSDSVVVQAGADAVWDVIADFDRYPEWNDEVREVEVLETDEQGWGTTVRFKIDAGVFNATLVLAYTYTDDRMSWWLTEGDKVKKNDGAYTLDARPDGTTQVTYELEVEPAFKVPGVLKRQAARRIVSQALKAMKERAEA